MSRGSDIGKGVRFADPSVPSSIPPLTPATSTAAVDCRLGFLLVGGLYASDLFTIDAPSSIHDDQLSEPQPEARGLTASNLSVGVEPGASSGQRRVVLRLWADREGPFEARFALGLPPDQEVQVHVTATVFNRKKGTPGLKPHVRCLGFSADTDTEAASDWQGFA